MAQTGDDPKPRKRIPCPICRAPSDPACQPFCSSRCADVDLSRWLRGGYAIPVSEDDDEDGEAGAALSDVAAEARNGKGDLH